MLLKRGGRHRGEIHLTPLGRKVATGTITQAEFAAVAVQQTILPNPWTYSDDDTRHWRAAGLEIRPLALILEILETLGRSYGAANAHMTPRELVAVCIPLAGERHSAALVAENIERFRRGELDLTGWPNCAPEANDERIAREFLIFLANFGFCTRVAGPNAMEERYVLEELGTSDGVIADPLRSMFDNPTNVEEFVDQVRHSETPAFIERQRRSQSVLARPNQGPFRNAVLRAYHRRCFLTRESVEDVIEAAHIIPVRAGGEDTTANGLCLRVDIHRLFDSGSIRIRPDGEVRLSDTARGSPGYAALPQRVELPGFVSPANVRWRDEYY